MGGYIGKSQGVVLVDGYTQAEVNAAIAANTEITRSASAPSNPTAGDLWYDTTINILFNYDGTAWQRLTNDTFEATGGTQTTSGAYTIHTFTSSGTFQVTSGARNVEYLVIGGGGGGGIQHAGGGGAGGYRTN